MTTTLNVPSDPTSEQDAGSHEILTRESRFADSFKRDYPLVWWGTLVGPFIATALLLVYLGLERGWAFVLKLAGTAVFTFFVTGRFTILAGSDPQSETARFMTANELFVMVTWMDLFAACLLIFHAGFIFRIPKIGPGMLQLREDGEFILKLHPWMRRFTFIGMVLFVAFPLAATGSVAGSIFGRLLGLSRKATMAGLVAGTLLGNGAMFLGKSAINAIPFFDAENPLNLIGGAAVIAGLIVLLNGRYRKMKKEWAVKGRPVLGRVADAPDQRAPDRKAG